MLKRLTARMSLAVVGRTVLLRGGAYRVCSALSAAGVSPLWRGAAAEGGGGLLRGRAARGPREAAV